MYSVLNKKRRVNFARRFELSILRSNTDSTGAIASNGANPPPPLRGTPFTEGGYGAVALLEDPSGKVKGYR